MPIPTLCQAELNILAHLGEAVQFNEALDDEYVELVERHALHLCHPDTRSLWWTVVGV